MASFASFRSRLVFLFALATLPAVALALVLSWRVYVNAKEAEQDSFRRAVISLDMQEQAIVRATLRIARTLLADLPERLLEPNCKDRLGRVVQANQNFTALAVLQNGEVRCGSGKDATLAELSRASVAAEVTQTTVRQDYGFSIIGKGQPILTLSMTGTPDSPLMAMALDRDWFAEAMNRVVIPANGTAAFLGPAGDIVLTTGETNNSSDWMPKDLAAIFTSSNELTEATSRDGRAFIYLHRFLENRAMHAVVGFPVERFGVAERQLAIGLAFPLLMFAIVIIVTWIAIEQLFLVWVRKLDATARRLAFGDFTVRAELPEDAPIELRQYARAFDQMTTTLSARTQELTSVAQQRSMLLRELHHRVKNNFQVIASFLNLMKRERTGEAREALALSESRVHAMAAAYKLALAQGDIRLVSVPVLVEDVMNYIQNTVDVSLPRLALALPDQGDAAFVDLDRAIPLALLIVEILWPALQADPSSAESHVMKVGRVGGDITLTIRGPEGTQRGPYNRFSRAFLQQLGATDMTDPPDNALLAIVMPVELAHHT